MRLHNLLLDVIPVPPGNVKLFVCLKAIYISRISHNSSTLYREPPTLYFTHCHPDAWLSDCSIYWKTVLCVKDR